MLPVEWLASPRWAVAPIAGSAPIVGLGPLRVLLSVGVALVLALQPLAGVALALALQLLAQVSADGMPWVVLVVAPLVAAAAGRWRRRRW